MGEHALPVDVAVAEVGRERVADTDTEQTEYERNYSHWATAQADTDHEIFVLKWNAGAVLELSREIG